MLTLLRHPDILQRLRRQPDLAVPIVEELLRYEPPVQLLPNRIALDDIDIAGTTIPRGAAITLVLAAGSRDPDHVADPDQFDPDRPDLEHLGFGGGIHYCFGAPSPGPKRKSPSPNSSGGWSSRGSSPIRRPTGRTRPCADPGT
jgi:cytochrome P450